MSYKIFYINLDKAIERKQKIQKDLETIFPTQNINRFAAIDKSNLTNEYIKYILNPRSYYYLEINNHKRAVHEDINSKGHLGCYLSHLSLWQQLLNESTVDYYIIFEDDVNISPEFKTTVEGIINKVEFDFISLIYISRRINDKLSVNYPDLYDMKNPFFGTQSYILNKKAANALSVWSKHLTAQVDAFIGYVSLYENNLNFYMFKKPLGNTGTFDTDIEHGNCIRCDGDDLFQIRIKTGFGLYNNRKGYISSKDENYVSINIKYVLLVLLLCCIFYYVYKKN